MGTENIYLFGGDEGTYVTQMSILESTEDKRPGVLSTVEGPFMVIEENNNNGRFYTKSLIDNKILGNKSAMNQMQNKTLFGEPSHPKDRFDVDLNLISHVITALWWDEDGKTLMGRADILDTPGGRIIDTIVRYGSKIGISVRAKGNLVMKNKKQVPDEKTYLFKTFDFVPNPGFSEARMTLISESENDEISLEDSMMKYIEAAPLSDLKCINTIFESVADDMFPMAREALKTRMENDTLSSPEVSSLNEEEMYEEVVQMGLKNLELNERIEELEAKLAETQKSILNEGVEEGSKNTDEDVKILSKINEQLESEVEQSKTVVSELTEINHSLRGKVSELTRENQSLRARVDRMANSLYESRDDNSRLRTALEKSRSDKARLEEVVSELTEQINEAEEDEEPVRPIRAVKVLPQKVHSLNESIVNNPVITDNSSEIDTRVVGFINKCT